MSLPRYPKYKDSGVAWLGEVPEHWGVAPFKTQIDRNDGGVWGDDPDGINDTFVLRSTEQTVDGHWRMDDPAPRKLTESEIKSALLIEGDLLLTKSSGSSLHIGKTTLVSKEVAAMRCCYSNFMQRIRTKASFMPELAWYVLNNDLARLQFDLLSNSTTGLANLNGTMVGQIVIPVPPVPEQIQIATFLDRETAKIDELVAEQQRLMELLKEKRQSVISHAVTRGLNPDAPLKPSGIEWLGDVPEHWDVAKMKWIARMESGHTPDKKIPAYWENGDIPWVSLNDTGYLKGHDYITETAYNISEMGMANSSARLLPARVVVFSRDATIGRCAITTRPMAVSQHFIAWICGDLMIPEFLLMRLRSMTDELNRLTTGATLKTIGMPDVRTLVTPVPPLAEQQAIVNWVADASTQLDTLTFEAQRAIDLLQERRTAMISAAFTAQMDVRGHVPAEVAV